MKKAPKIEYGIEITKPWSKAMYAHNDRVADAVRVKVFEMWTNGIDASDVDGDADWEYAATPAMIKIQRAVLCHSFGSGFDVAEVDRRIVRELEEAPYYRLKDIAEDLALDLKQGFVGF